MITKPTLVDTAPSFYDDRGYFQEILRNTALPFPVKQIAMSQTFPGVIKAFHRHKVQWDYWYLVSGQLKIFTWDDNGEILPFHLAGEDHKMLIIPPGWWHGYKVVGTEPSHMLYMLSEEYDINNPDEEKTSPYKSIVNWDTENR